MVFALFYAACPLGYFGQFQCDQQCHCMNSAPCYPVAGTCFKTDLCARGWLTADTTGSIPDLYCNVHGTRPYLFLCFKYLRWLRYQLSLNIAWQPRLYSLHGWRWNQLMLLYVRIWFSVFSIRDPVTYIDKREASNMSRISVCVDQLLGLWVGLGLPHSTLCLI